MNQAKDTKIPMHIENRNLFSFIARDTLFNLNTVFCAVSIIQAFLIMRGVNGFGIGVIVTAINLIQVAANFSFMGISDRLKNPIKTIGIFTAIAAIFPISLIFICLFSSLSTTVVFIFTLITYSVFNFIASIRYLCLVKLNVYLVNSHNLGRFLGIASLVSNIVFLFSGFISIKIMNSNEESTGYIICFTVAAIAILISMITGLFLKPVNYLANTSAKVSPLLSMLKMVKTPEFYKLIPHNFIRGIGSGLSSMLLTIGIYRLGMSGAYGAIITTATKASFIIGTIIYTFAALKIPSEKFLFAGYTICGIGFVGAFFSSDALFFIISAIVIFIGQSFIDCGVVPSASEIVPNEEIGVYSAARLLTTMAGSSLSTFIVGIYVESDAIGIVMLVFALLMLCGGFNALINLRRFKKALCKNIL